MKITPISVFGINNLYKNKVKQNNIFINYSFAQNTISPVYSKNYYLSFKGSQKSEEIQALEQFVNDFYEENKGVPVSSCSEINEYDLPIEIPSRFVRDEFVNCFNSSYKKTAKAHIDDEKLIEILDDSLNQTKNLMKRAKIQIPDLKAAEIIGELKQNKKIPEKINFATNSYEFKDIKDKIYMYLHNTNIENEDNKRFFLLVFMDKYRDNQKRYNTPLLDKAFVEEMKGLLKEEEPFKTFNQKMIKIREQDAKNQSPTLKETIDEINKDIIKKHLAPFDNPKIYNYVSQHDEKLDYLLEQIYGYAKPEYDNLFERSGVDKKHKVLLIDPAFASRFEEFCEFVENEKINTKEIEPFELRQKFSNYLGTETVYRGIYFDNPQDGINELKQNGCFASIFNKKDKIEKSLEYFISPNSYLDYTIREILSNKITSPQSGNEFLSVTSVYDIAASVPKNNGDPKCPVVVVKLELPKLSLIKQKNRFANIQHGPERVLNVNGKKYPYGKQQEKIEAFVPFFMPTNNAEYIVDTSTDGFYWSDY